MQFNRYKSRVIFLLSNECDACFLDLCIDDRFYFTAFCFSACYRSRLLGLVFISFYPSLIFHIMLQVNVVQSSRGLSVKTKLHSLKIKDELQGRLSMSSNYLACSVINDNLETVDSSSPDEEDHRKSFSVEEDSFMDALTDFTPDQSPNLQDLEIPSNSIFDPDGHTQLSSKDGLSFDGDQQKVKPTEVFYEAQDNNINDFVVLTFLTRTPDSWLYDGIDSQVI